MVRSRKDDLKNAKEVSEALGLKFTADLIATMEKNIGERKRISWSMFEEFLDIFEIDAYKRSQICSRTFKTMEAIIMRALGESEAKSRSNLKDRALNAPPIDPHIDVLAGSLSIIHNEINEMKPTIQTQTLVLLSMFGHVIRWQALWNFTTEWVGHYGRGISEELKEKVKEELIWIKYGLRKHMKADTRLYRNAIAHGHFRFKDEHHVEFWTRDSCGKRRGLRTLNSGDIVKLSDFTEIRLRTMEIFGRVLRAWGRHGDIV